MTTANEILTRARYPMRDASEVYWPDTELLDYLNAAIADLCSRERLVREQTDGTTASDGTIDIPANFLSVRWVKNPNGIEVAWMDESTFFDYVSTYPSWPSTSPIATIFDDKVWLHPNPGAGQTWKMGNLQVPTLLTATNDTFPLRRIWEAKCIAWLQAEMYAKDGEFEMSRRKYAQYEAGLRPAQAVTDHQVPGRVNIAIEPNVFDTDPDSIHRGA